MIFVFGGFLKGFEFAGGVFQHLANFVKVRIFNGGIPHLLEVHCCIAAGTGLAEGFVALTPGQAEELHRAGLPSVLVIHEIMPEDIGALRASAGIVTVRGGITGEAAVMARGLAKPCVASGSALSLGSGEVHNAAAGGGIRPYERITIDGGTGQIVRGAAARHLGEVPPAVTTTLYSPASDGTVGSMVNDAPVAPGMGVLPFCHWYVAAPVATTLKLADCPAVTPVLAGCCVIGDTGRLPLDASR